LKTRYLPLAVVGLLLAGCVNFRSAGRDVVGGAMDELDRRGGTASLTRNAAAGARDELTSEESQQKLKALQTAMMQQMTIDAAKMRQELLGEAFRADVDKARAEFLENSRRDLNRMRDELLGARTRDAAGAVADRIVGDITRENVGRLRDEILGERSRLMAEQLVHQTGSSMQREMDMMRVRLETEKRGLEDDLRHTLWASSIFIAGLGAVVVALVAVVRRRERIIEALTEPIQALSDGRSYEDLTRKITERARELGVSNLVNPRIEHRERREPRGGNGDGPGPTI
jgi:hypothetical protein